MTPDIMLILLIFTTWILNFKVLRTHVVNKSPMNSEVIKFFDDNKLIDIYYALAKGNKDAFEENRNITDRKSKMLYRGYIAIIITWILLLVFAFLFFCHSWNNPVNC